MHMSSDLFLAQDFPWDFYWATDMDILHRIREIWGDLM